jgi:hypothetical protein
MYERHMHLPIRLHAGELLIATYQKYMLFHLLKV